MNKALAAVFTGHGKPFELREYELTRPAAGYARLSIIASGVCGTDLHIHRGKLGCGAPSIIGHEFVGRIEDISREDSLKYGLAVGDAVISDIAVPCGKCPLCLQGDDANCVNLGVTNGGDPEVEPHFHGGFAQFNYSPVTNLIKIPASLDPTGVAVFACAGPTGLHAFGLAGKAGVSLDSINTAVVQGLGPVGLFACAYLSSIGVANIITVTGRDNPARAEKARLFGATDCLSLSALGEEGVCSFVKDKTGGLGADLCFEGSGNPSAFAQGLDMLRNRGVYLVPGQYSSSGGVTVSPEVITFKALHIIGSSQYSIADVETYLSFLSVNPKVAVNALSAASFYPVADINLAVADAGAGKNIKTLLVK